MNYFQAYLPSLDETIVAAWDSQVAEAAETPWLAQALATKSADLFPRFADAYAQLRALPRGARRALQRQLARSGELAIPLEWRQKLATSLAGAALLLALGQGSAQALNITVETNKPGILADGLCSLIEAIQNANDTTGTPPHADCDPGDPAGADRILLPANKTNTLTATFNTYYGSATGLPRITSPITIEGPGTIARKTTGPQFRLLAVGSAGNLTLKNVTLKGGRTTTSGGAVFNNGNLTVDTSTISGNRALGGAGIFNNDNATATITGSTISSNLASYAGGGIYNNPSSTVAVQDSTVSRNRAPNYGGGIINYNATLTINNSTISGNRANYGGGVHNGGVLNVVGSTLSGNRAFSGGAIWNDDYHTATVTNSTISGNWASYGGGGVAVDVFSSLTVQNSTITGNSARVAGGGISNYATVTINNSTVTANSARVAGGGIFNGYYFYNATQYIGTLTVANSTISANKARYGAGIFNDIHSTVTVDNSAISGNKGARGWAAEY